MQGQLGKGETNHTYSELATGEFLKAARASRNEQRLSDRLGVLGNNEPSIQRVQSVHPNGIGNWLAEMKMEKCSRQVIVEFKAI